MSVEEAAELARRAIYHATFRDGASGGVASGTLPFSPIEPATSTYRFLYLFMTFCCYPWSPALDTHDTCTRTHIYIQISVFV